MIALVLEKQKTGKKFRNGFDADLFCLTNPACLLKHILLKRVLVKYDLAKGDEACL